MQPPRVTVVLTIFNGARHLNATLESLAAQRFKDFEVLCGDDHSSDASPEIVAERAKEDPRFRLVRQSANLGSSPRVMRRLLPAIRGRFMAYSSQDDLFSEDWLESMVSRAEEVGADGVAPDVEFFEEGRPSTKRLSGLRGDRSAVLSGREAAALSLDWQIPGFVLWKTELVRSVGYSDFAMNGDEYTARRLFLAARTIAFSAGTFFYRQDNPDAITKKLSIGSFDLPVTHFHTWRLFKDAGFGDNVCDAELMRSVASLVYYARRLAGARNFSAGDRRDAELRLDRAQALLTRGAARERLMTLLRTTNLADRAKILVVLGPSFLRRTLAERTRLTQAGPTA